MTKLTIPLVALALATAACTRTSAIHPSSTLPNTNPGQIEAQPRGNTATELSDLTRSNPPVQPGVRPAAPARSQPTTTSASATTVGQDRCSTAFGGGLGPPAGRPGPNHLPPPMCPPE